MWVYTSDVLNDAGAQPGAMVHVVGPKEKILGSAIYSSSSQIKLRLLAACLDHCEFQTAHLRHLGIQVGVIRFGSQLLKRIALLGQHHKLTFVRISQR